MFRPSVHKLSEVQQQQINLTQPQQPPRRLSLTIDLNNQVSNDDIYSKTRGSCPSSPPIIINLEQQNQKYTNITLTKGPAGFGIAISEDRNNRLIIRGINVNGVAYQVREREREIDNQNEIKIFLFKDGKMKIGDEIIAVNDKNVNTMKYDDVMHLLHITTEPVQFRVISHGIIFNIYFINYF